jgi:DNA-binding CsgD family transcriptional regulator
MTPFLRCAATARQLIGPPVDHAEASLPEQWSQAILDRLCLAVFVLTNGRIVYSNEAGQRLIARVRRRYNVELAVLLRDQLSRLSATTSGGEPLVSLLTTPRGDPFHLHVLPLDGERVAITMRDPGAELDAFKRTYALSNREAQVAELALCGYRNREIAGLLGITSETAKKHLSRVFGKVGVQSRVQLANRLA